ncbi:hypothetical protein D3C81_1518970 [compost metagenome]
MHGQFRLQPVGNQTADLDPVPAVEQMFDQRHHIVGFCRHIHQQVHPLLHAFHDQTIAPEHGIGAYLLWPEIGMVLAQQSDLRVVLDQFFVGDAEHVEAQLAPGQIGQAVRGCTGRPY